MSTKVCTQCKGIAGTIPVMRETSRTNMVDSGKTKVTQISPSRVTANVAESDQVIVYTCPFCGYSETVTTVYDQALIGVAPCALQYS